MRARQTCPQHVETMDLDEPGWEADGAALLERQPDKELHRRR